MAARMRLVAASLVLAVLLAVFQRVIGVNTYASPLTGILPPALLLLLHPVLTAWDRHMACHVSTPRPKLPRTCRELGRDPMHAARTAARAPPDGCVRMRVRLHRGNLLGMKIMLQCIAADSVLHQGIRCWVPCMTVAMEIPPDVPGTMAGGNATVFFPVR